MIPTCVGNIFSIYGVHILRKSLNLCLFTHAPVPHSKLLVELFENLFSQRQKGLEEAMICSVKIQSETIKMTWEISLFPFDMIAIFLIVMTLSNSVVSISNSVVLSLLPLLCNHGNLTLKLHQKI